MAEEGELTAEQLAEQIKQINVSDLLLSTVSTLGQLAYVKLSAGDRDQARLAIDGLAAVLPTLEGQTDEQLLRDLKQLLANVRLAYTSAVSADAEAPPPEAASGSEPHSPEAPGADAGATDVAPEGASGSEPQSPAEPQPPEADGES